MTNPNAYGEASDISVPTYQRGFQTAKSERSVGAIDVEGHVPDWLTGTAAYGTGPVRVGT
jgi:hypothetical protein